MYLITLTTPAGIMIQRPIERPEVRQFVRTARHYGNRIINILPIN